MAGDKQDSLMIFSTYFKKKVTPSRQNKLFPQKEDPIGTRFSKKPQDNPAVVQVRPVSSNFNKVQNVIP